MATGLVGPRVASNPAPPGSLSYWVAGKGKPFPATQYDKEPGGAGFEAWPRGATAYLHKLQLSASLLVAGSIPTIRDFPHRPRGRQACLFGHLNLFSVMFFPVLHRECLPPERVCYLRERSSSSNVRVQYVREREVIFCSLLRMRKGESGNRPSGLSH